MVKPVLVFAYGNLSRGDDALGPLLLNHIEEGLKSDAVELLSDFQLQIEHALDLPNRELVLFVDASVACQPPFGLTELKAVQDLGYTTHAMNPSAVLAVYQTITKQLPPPSFLLSIKGESFELGEGLSVRAGQHLAEAFNFVDQLLDNLSLASWRQFANQGVVC
jgi:hydrogenase maturation protease